MMVHPNQVKVLWYGREVDWHSFNLTPPDGSPGYVIVCTDSGHYAAEDQIEIYYAGKLYYHSPDVWFAGMIKPY
jgi:esterase/lipase superfamily enzyme